MNFKILITSVGGEFAPNLILSIKNDKKISSTIIGTDLKKDAIGKNFCDLFYQVPKANSKNYIKKIALICRKNKIDLVLPTSDEEAYTLSKNRKLIENNKTKLACTDFNTIKIFNDKVSTYRKLKQFNIPRPKYVIVNKLLQLDNEIIKMLKECKEIVIKPSNSRGGRNVFIISNKIKGFKIFDDRREIITDLKNFRDKFKKNLNKSYPLIIMNKLKEPVYDLDMLAWKGKPLRIIPRKRFNSAVPNDGHIIVNDQKLIELGKKIILKFNLSWLYDCDIMYDQDNVPQILEINPRPSGSVVVSICAGVPLIRDLLFLSKGLKVNKINLPFNKRIIPYKNLYQLD